MKTCTRCKEPKPPSEFGNWNAGKDGKRPDCKTCRKAESKAQQARQNERRRERHATDPEYRERIKQHDQKYAAASNIRMRKYAAVLSDTYVIAAIKRHTELKTADIKQHPELIAAWRETMRTRRLIRKTTQHEKRKRITRKADQALPATRRKEG